MNTSREARIRDANLRRARRITGLTAVASLALTGALAAGVADGSRHVVKATAAAAATTTQSTVSTATATAASSSSTLSAPVQTPTVSTSTPVATSGGS